MRTGRRLTPSVSLCMMIFFIATLVCLAPLLVAFVTTLQEGTSAKTRLARSLLARKAEKYEPKRSDSQVSLRQVLFHTAAARDLPLIRFKILVLPPELERARFASRSVGVWSGGRGGRCRRGRKGSRWGSFETTSSAGSSGSPVQTVRGLHAWRDEAFILIELWRSWTLEVASSPVAVHGSSDELREPRGGGLAGWW